MFDMNNGTSAVVAARESCLNCVVQGLNYNMAVPTATA
jgi:hypothetical protein